VSSSLSSAAPPPWPSAAGGSDDGERGAAAAAKMEIPAMVLTARECGAPGRRALECGGGESFLGGRQPAHCPSDLGPRGVL